MKDVRIAVRWTIHFLNFFKNLKNIFFFFFKKNINRNQKAFFCSVLVFIGKLAILLYFLYYLLSLFAEKRQNFSPSKENKKYLKYFHCYQTSSFCESTVFKRNITENALEDSFAKTQHFVRKIKIWSPQFAVLLF